VPTLSPTQVLSRVEPVVVGGLLRLPPGIQRRLAGKPVVRDGDPLEVETQLLLRLQALAGRGELGFGPEARAGIDRDSVMVGGEQPVGEYRNLEVGGAEGPLPARLYVPQALVRTDRDPLLVFFHGGGFVTGGLDSHDATCRVLAERAGVRVLSVAYRLAPEHPFPAAPHDCAAAYRWVVEHAGELGADPARLAVGGDSAGGNLAAVTAIAAARDGLPLKFQLLVYPVTDAAARTESRELFAAGFFLTRAAMEEATGHYLGDQDRSDPLASPLHADLPDGLAPAYVATAGFDPLRDEGEAYARKLADAGVEVTQRRFGGHIHSFFNVVGVGSAARTAVEEIADALAAGL
jgi:acetyl esterase